MGLNINQEKFPPDLREKATSMKLESGRTYNRREALLNLLDFLDGELRRYRKDGFEKIREEMRRSFSLKVREVVLISEKPEAGILLGIDEEGFPPSPDREGVKEDNRRGEVSLRPRL
ncbi:MAG: hypothetical protein Q9N34_02270 [Aquificota bacterium]|nr:hypothetical protein [Aquificota bacterium]